MRATSTKRRAKTSKALTRLAPVKNQETGAWFGVVEQVRLHPDHHISAERAAELGLVTRLQIARAFGLSEGTPGSWALTNGHFPKPKAHLRRTDNGKALLYSADEVVAWLRHYRPQVLARARTEKARRSQAVTDDGQNGGRA